jgi:hypothetical protein
MGTEYLRIQLENTRRARLHREIAALEASLFQHSGLENPARARIYFRLRSKIRRKQAELRQPMLVSLTE